MKNWLRSTPGKVLCFILCILTMILAVAASVGGVMMLEEGFYFTSREVMTEQLHRSLLYSDAYDILFDALDGVEGYRFKEQNTNLRYKVVSGVRQTVDTNITGQPKTWQYAFYLADGTHRYAENHDPKAGPVADTLTLYLYLEPDLPANDQYAFFSQLLRLAYGLRDWVWGIAGGCLLLSILFFVILMCVSAHKPHSEELHPGALHKVPSDLLLPGVLFLLILVLDTGMTAFRHGGDLPELIFLILWVLNCACTCLGLCMSVAARIKTRTLLKNTVIARIFRLIRRLWKHLVSLVRGLPTVWRTALLVLALVFFDFMTMALSRSPLGTLLWLVQNIMLAVGLLCAALMMRKLLSGGEALAKGDLNYKIDTSMLFGDLKQHGEDLNRIAQGMTAAVEQRLRSERMRTELITNVSHDIKTPLTSIINYATLMGEASCECENHRTYAEVLVRKSNHLRRLLDDLVEASRASTGNLEVVLAPCDAGVLLTQAAGEYAERLTAAGLELLTAQPEQPVMILADSRRIWRVFENLMSNICKHSLPGTRVFLRLETVGNEAVITFRNTSRGVLNISPEALMERFVRGDAARSTEGSGLGLSIAQSLTQLQNGHMDISIDGDFFKVTLRFPMA